MKRSISMMVAAAVAAAAAAACAEAVTEPHQRNAADAPHMVISCDDGSSCSSGGTVPTATDTALTVTLSAPTKVLSQSYVTLTATASGGTGPYDYIWTEQVCYDAGTDCYEDVYAEGPQNSISYGVSDGVNTARIVVQVKDASTTAQRSGNARRNILGPAAFVFGTGSTFHCQSPNQYFPFQFTPNAPQYIRSGCDGHKMYPPTTP